MLLFGDLRDGIFGGVMIINAVIGIVSELRAKRTLDSLAIVDAPQATVLRDGTLSVVPARDVVLDDVIIVIISKVSLCFTCPFFESYIRMRLFG